MPLGVFARKYTVDSQELFLVTKVKWLQAGLFFWMGDQLRIRNSSGLFRRSFPFSFLSSFHASFQDPDKLNLDLSYCDKVEMENGHDAPDRLTDRQTDIELSLIHI